MVTICISRESMPTQQVLRGDMFVDRQVVVEVQGKQISFQILAVLEFNSDRKRMSVLCRLPDGRSVCKPCLRISTF